LKTHKPLKTIDQYIVGYSPQVQEVLERIRSIVQSVAPEAEERISYQMPAFSLDGMLIYFAAFQKHIGIYPPVKGDAKLQQDLAPYRGEKGNLKFPLDRSMPYALIRRVVKFRLKEHLAQRAAKRAKKTTRKTP
jgi:uncharacterized protein YdhG (YjbR/CyaY superfamily)